MIRNWWNKKSAKDKWKIKAGIAWFGGGLGILIAITKIFFAPKFNAFLDKASPAELAEVDAFINNQMMWMLGIMLVLIIVSIVVNCYCGKNSTEGR